MKKLGKILTLVLSLALVVTALVVIGAADDSGTASEKNWVVEGATGEDGLGGFDSFASALAEAGGTTPIKLNRDIDITDNLSITASAIVDLNGHTITETRTTSASACVFPVSGSDTSFTLQGSGSIVNCSKLILVTSDASGVTIGLNGTGDDGISVTMNESTAAHGFNLITLANRCSTMTVKGKIAVIPYDSTPKNGNNAGVASIFSIGDKASTISEDSIAELIFDGASFTVNKPHSKESNPDGNLAGVWLANISDGVRVTVKNGSTIDIKHGNAFYAENATTVWKTAYWSHGTDTNAVGKLVSVTDNLNPQTATKTIWIDIDDSTVHAYQSGWCKADNYSNAGALFSLGSARALVTADNSELGGANRTIGTLYTYFNEAANKTVVEADAKDGQIVKTDNTTVGEVLSQGRVVSSYFLFNNVDYVYDTATKYTSPWLITGSVNIKWNGGTINNPDIFAGDSYAYSEFDYDGDGTSEAWFGVQFSNVFCNKDQTPGLNGTYRVNAFSYKGTKYTDVSFFDNGNVLTAKVAFLDEPYTLPYELVSDRTSTFSNAEGGKVDLNSNTKSDGENFDTLSIGTRHYGAWMVHGDTARYGGIAEVKDGDNGYVKFYVDEMNVQRGGNSGINFDEIKYWGYDKGDKTYAMGNYKYFVHEFDLATDTGTYTSGAISAFARYWNNGSLTTMSASLFTLENNTLSFSESSWSKTSSSELLQLPTDGSWARITLVYEVIRTDATVSAENDAWDYSGTKLHVYRDGKWIGTMSGFLTTKVVKTFDSNFSLDAFRFEFYQIVGSSTCIDNNRLSAYTETTATDALTAITNNASSVNLNDYKNDFLVMPKSNNITMPNVSVTWKGTDGATLGTTEVGIGSLIAPTDDILAAAGGSRQEQNNGWYDLGLGWKDESGNVVDLTSLKAETGKTYTFTATTAPIAPEKGVSGIKINLSLRLDFDLNFYVPVPEEGLDVSNIMIKKGTTKLDSGTINDGGNKYVYGQEVTVLGNLYTKHRDSYGVAELGTRTYTLSYTVGSTVITQDITYGVSNYVAQYMKTNGDSNLTEDQVPRELVLRMVNYVVQVVNHEDSKITKTDEINKVITYYENLIDKYNVTPTETTYFTTNEGVLARIKVSRASVMGKTENEDGTYTMHTEATESDLAYYVGGANLYFSTGTPKFIFKYTDKALALGIKAPSGSYVGWGGSGVWTYTDYADNGTQGVHLALDKDGNKVTDKWGGDTVKDGSVTYYATMIDTNFRGKTYAIYDMLKSWNINLSYRVSDAADITISTGGKYCIEWYINGLITNNEPEADINLAIALYDYACAAYKFVNGSAYSYDSYINEASYLIENKNSAS